MRALMIPLLLATFLILGAVTSAKAQALPGVNLSGGEFHGFALYQQPSEIDFYADRGFKLFRIPVTRQRLQPVLYGDLAAGHLAKIDALYAKAQERGVTLILDEHSFGQGPAPAYFDGARKKSMTSAAIDQVLPDGTMPFPHLILSDFWVKMAKRYPLAWLDLQNEPWEPVPALAATAWAASVQAIANDLKAAGVTNRLVIEGMGSSAVGRWHNTSPRPPAIPNLSGDAFAALNDGKGLDYPDYIFSPHMYLDKLTAGINGECVQDEAIFRPMTEWARSKGYRYMLGEFAFGSWKGIPASCVERGARVIAYMKANPDVWVGWTIYGAGLAWNTNYFFATAPKGFDRSKGPDEDPAYLKAIR